MKLENNMYTLLHLDLGSATGPNLEPQNIECQNLKPQNIECQNLRRQNIECQNLKPQNI